MKKYVFTLKSYADTTVLIKTTYLHIWSIQRAYKNWRPQPHIFRLMLAAVPIHKWIKINYFLLVVAIYFVCSSMPFGHCYCDLDSSCFYFWAVFTEEPLKMKSSLIMQIINLLYFQHNFWSLLLLLIEFSTIELCRCFKFWIFNNLCLC